MKTAVFKAAALDFERPWPGLLSFTETGSAFFFGRSQEIAELHRRVKNQTLTILFGQSGYGKTSLVLAGLFPKLRGEGFQPIRLRPDYESDLSVVDQVKQHVAREFDGSADTKASLWECFHRIENPLCSGRDGRTPCLVFDQFEEIFTLGHKSRASLEQVDAFLQELSCLVENTVPPALEMELERDPQSAEGFEFARQGYRVVIVLREDYLADFEGLKRRMPAIMQNRMRLGRLTRAQALEAIRGPAGRAPQPLIRLEVARRIVDFVMGQPTAETGSLGTKCVELVPAIDPALLNLLCRELNEKRLEAGEMEITEDLVNFEQTAILTDFYERQLRQEPKAVRQLIEDELVTDTGHREGMSLEKAASKLERAGVSPDSLERLVRGRLLRIEDRLDRKRVEVAHDILTGVIRKSRQTRELEDAKRLAEAEKQQAEEQKRLALMRMRRAAVLFLGGLVIAALFCYSFYRQAEMQRALAAEEREKLAKERQQSEQARERSQALLHLAESHLASEDDPKKDVLGLFYVSRALRFDRGNGAVTRRVCELLSQRTWCPPLSPVLQFNSESALLCATWDPNGNLIVVSKDGQFLRWNGTGHELRPTGSVPSQPALATSAEATPSLSLRCGEAAKFSSGFFSCDGRYLVLFSIPRPSRATAQIRGWSQATGSYDSILQTIEIKDSAHPRVVWGPDGKTLVIVSGGWDHSSCQVFRYNGDLYQEIANPFGNTNVAAACFSEDDKWLGTESPDGAVQLWDPVTFTSTAAPAQVLGSFGLASNLRPRSLAFGPGKDEMVTVLFDGSVIILDLRSGSRRSGYARDKQVMSFAFSPQQSTRRLAAAVLRGSIVISNPDTLDQPIAEPICLQGAFCSARFSSDGTKLLTVSGPFWDALDAVRVWDLSLQEPLPTSVTLPPDSTLVPTWLAELGQVVSAQWRNLDDEDVPASLDALAKKYSAKEVEGPYAAIWKRFFSSPSLSLSPPLASSYLQK